MLTCTPNHSPEDFRLKGVSYEVNLARYEKAIAQGKGVRLDTVKEGQRFRAFDGINTFIKRSEAGEFLVRTQARYSDTSDYLTHYDNTQGWVVVVVMARKSRK